MDIQELKQHMQGKISIQISKLILDYIEDLELRIDQLEKRFLTYGEYVDNKR